MAAPMEVSPLDAVKQLMAKKEKIESEINDLSDLLQSQQNIGMDGPLIDNEQFPRADIDIFSVRHARNRIICLQNDHKSLMKEIEEALHMVHAEARAKKEAQGGQPMEVDTSPHTATAKLRPFATIDRVDLGSPAQDAGVKVGDGVIQFGSVTTENFRNLQSIATVVQHSQDKPLSLTVSRDQEEIHLTLTPKLWSGRGLLG